MIPFGSERAIIFFSAIPKFNSTLIDLFLLGHVKPIIYSTNARSLEVLRADITDVTYDTTENLLEDAFSELSFLYVMMVAMLKISSFNNKSKYFLRSPCV